MNNLELNVANFNISPLFILLLTGGLLGIITFLFLQRYKETPGVRFWQIWQIATSIWAFTYAFEYASTDIESKIMWSKFSYFGIVYCSVSFFFFSLEFSSQFRLLKKKFIVVMYSIATLFILSPFTNGIHHLHWVSYSINTETHATNYTYGPFFWLFFAFSYITLIGGMFNIGMFCVRLSNHYKRQMYLLFFSSFLPMLGNLIYVFHINPIPGFDWTPFSFLLTGILVAINVSQFSMFDLVPFARNKLMEIIPDAILIVNKSLRIADYNQTMYDLINDNKKELIGQRLDVMIPHRQELIEMVTSNSEFQTEISLCINGADRHFDLQTVTLFDHKKESTGQLIILKDVTRHFLAEEEIKQANIQLTDEIQEKEKLIGDLDAFSHTVAHDLQNMLGSIVSASNLIQKGVDDMTKDELLEINEMINLAATKTMHVTKELLTLASVRQQEIKPLPVDMLHVITESVKRVQDILNSKNAQLSFPDQWPVILGNESWLEEVWINYLSNAVKYGGTPPKIELGSEILSNGYAKFWIKDNGKGLSSEEITLLFNKFTRLDTLRAKGHGLGLSIVKRIIEKQNGEVGIESKNIPGEGSTFFFILPLA